MAIVNGYCTREELEQWNTAQPTAAAMLERAIEACSRGIDQYCQRHFWKTAAGTVRVFDTCDPDVLKLGPFNDLETVTAVRTDPNRDGTYETTWSASDYQAGPRNTSAAPETRPYVRLRAIGSHTFPLRLTERHREGLVEVTGTWGWTAVPTDITQACLIQAARIFKRKDSPEGVAGWGDFGVIRVGRTDPDVISLLSPYIHPTAALLVA